MGIRHQEAGHSPPQEGVERSRSHPILLSPGRPSSPPPPTFHTTLDVKAQLLQEAPPDYTPTSASQHPEPTMSITRPNTPFPSTACCSRQGPSRVPPGSVSCLAQGRSCTQDHRTCQLYFIPRPAWPAVDGDKGGTQQQEGTDDRKGVYLDIMVHIPEWGHSVRYSFSSCLSLASQFPTMSMITLGIFFFKYSYL